MDKFATKPNFFRTLLDHLFGEGATVEKAYFRQWCAAPFIEPGVKLYVAVLLWGEMNGAGKSLVGEVLGALHGAYFKELKKKQIFSNFNEWAEDRTYCLGNEISPSDKQDVADDLKDLITQKSITLNKKFRSEIEVPDCIVYLFTSNHANAMFIIELDRRFCVCRVERKLSHETGTAIRTWINSSEGRSALMYEFLHTDMTGLDPKAPAPMTKAKEEMIDAGRSGIKHFARDLVAGARRSGEGKPDADNDLYPVEELVQAYKDRTGTTASPTAMGNALRDAGALNRGVIYLFDGPLGARRYWALANGEYWAGRDTTAVGDAIRRSQRFSSSDLDRWAAKLALNPELALSSSGSAFERDLYTSEELLAAADFERNPSLKDLDAALIRARVARTAPMGKDLGGVPLWIVSNAEYWIRQAPDEVAAGYKIKAKAPKF